MSNRKIKKAGHLNDDEEWLCVIFRVLQDVIWIGKKSKGINCASQRHSKKSEEFRAGVKWSESTHVAAVSWFGRWTLCSSPVNHLEGRRHTQTSRMDTECRMSGLITLWNWWDSNCLCMCYVAACSCFLTVVNTYMQLDLPQIYHGGYTEKRQNARGKNVHKTSNKPA